MDNKVTLHDWTFESGVQLHKDVSAQDCVREKKGYDL